MDTSDDPSQLSRNWTMGNTFFLLTNLGSLIIMITGGLMMLARMQTSTQAIPSLIETVRIQSLSIAVLQEQQRNLDGKYNEIMLQLARLDAKLDKQNDYLFESLQRFKDRQKNSYSPGNSNTSRFPIPISTTGLRSTPSP